MRFRFEEKSRLEHLEIEKRTDYSYNAVDTLRTFDPKFDLNHPRGQIQSSPKATRSAVVTARLCQDANHRKPWLFFT